MKFLLLLVLLGKGHIKDTSTGEWITESIVNAEPISSISISMDPMNNPAIAFCENATTTSRDPMDPAITIFETTTILKLATFDGSEWNIEDLVSGEGVKFCSLDYDNDGNPHIVFWSDTDYTIHYLVWNGTSWDDTLIDGGLEKMAGPECYIKIDSQGNPLIAYLARVATSPLLFAYRDGSDWIKTIIDPLMGHGINISMDLGSDGTPHVVYFDLTNYDLNYAVMGDRFWNTQTIDTQGIVGYEADIALDSNNLPHISYIDRTIGAIKYAYFDGEDWQICMVDSTGDPTGMLGTSIELDSNDLPRILCNDLVGDQVECAVFDGSSWTMEPVDNRGHSISMVIDSDDQLHVAYYQHSYNSQSLKYAYYQE